MALSLLAHGLGSAQCRPAPQAMQPAAVWQSPQSHCATRPPALVVACGPISLLNSLLKLAVDRPRPGPDLVRAIGTAAESSFPSGHAFLAIVFWGFLAYLAYTHLKAPGLRPLALFISVAMILLVGASRVYLGAHWPSDVLGGYVAGSVCLVLLIWVERRRSLNVWNPPEAVEGV